MEENWSILYDLPLWAIAVLFILILIGALKTGIFFGRRTDPARTKTADLVTLQAAILGLLALVLSFTYAFVSNRLETRKSAVINEANAIGTAYFRTDFAPEPQRGQLRNLLVLYARTRLVTHDKAGTREKVHQTIARSLKIQKQLWPVIRQIMDHPDTGPKEALLVQSINDVIDLHTVRVTASFDRLPNIVLVVMLAIGSLAMLITGYAAALSETTYLWPSMTFAVVLAFVMFVIVDMDRSLTGFVRVSQQPLVELIDSMI